MIFLGVFDPSSSSFSTEQIAALQGAVSRNPEDRPVLINRDHFALVIVKDVAFGEALNVLSSDAQVGLVSGRPYLDEKNAAQDANALLNALMAGDGAQLSAARGSYCALSYDPRAGVLKLCTDKVGIYPIYIARVGTRFFFSSALRMLQALPGVCSEFDVDGLFTHLAFGYSLGRRTAYGNVERMYGGEIFQCDLHSADPVIHRYWSWDSIKPQSWANEELDQGIHAAFLDAVRIRVDDSPGDLSFLSGGLDSRCIVAALREIERPVWTLNFAPEGAQDHLFGKLVAEKLGATHFELGLNKGTFPERQRKILDAWAEAHPAEAQSGVNRYRVWSGDGGSVGLGHVYLDAQFVSLLRAGSFADACDYYVSSRKCVVPVGMLSKNLHGAARLVPAREMLSEIASFQCMDRAKSGLLFLLLNDQRQHLTEYFENLDLYRFELVLPFFDARLLELVVSAPLDGFMRHEFYNRWLRQFPSGVVEVPWQAYPGHAPCPVPMEQYGALRYQWKEDWFGPAEVDRRFRSAVSDWERVLSTEAFPGVMLDKPRLQLALWLTRFKLRDYSYLLNAAKKVILFLPS